MVAEHNYGELIRTATAILACVPTNSPRYWPDSTRVVECTMEPVEREGFEFSLLTARTSQYVDTSDAAILAQDPDFKRKAVADAIAEVLDFAHQHLRDDSPAGAYRIRNHYLLDDIRTACRRNLTRLLATWHTLGGGL